MDYAEEGRTSDDSFQECVVAEMGYALAQILGSFSCWGEVNGGKVWDTLGKYRYLFLDYQRDGNGEHEGQMVLRTAQYRFEAGQVLHSLPRPRTAHRGHYRPSHHISHPGTTGLDSGVGRHGWYRSVLVPKKALLIPKQRLLVQGR